MVQKIEISLNYSVIGSNIFISSEVGNLDGVKWYIENQKVGKNERVSQTYQSHEFCQGDTPIHIACKNGHLPVVQYLIEQQKFDINIKGFQEKTPLHYACEKDHLPIVEYLISKGANINAKDRGGDYVIHYACRKGLLPIVQYLIEQQNVDIDIKNKYEETPLQYACEKGHLPIIEYLISKGANINAEDQFDNRDYVINSK